MAIYHSNKFGDINIDCAIDYVSKLENNDVAIGLAWDSDKIGWGTYTVIINEDGFFDIDDEGMESENFPFLGALLQSIADKQSNEK